MYAFDFSGEFQELFQNEDDNIIQHDCSWYR